MSSVKHRWTIEEYKNGGFSITDDFFERNGNKPGQVFGIRTEFEIIAEFVDFIKRSRCELDKIVKED
jgi:hypothetical protein